jgi:hypothetical protein
MNLIWLAKDTELLTDLRTECTEWQSHWKAPKHCNPRIHSKAIWKGYHSLGRQRCVGGCQSRHDLWHLPPEYCLFTPIFNTTSRNASGQGEDSSLATPRRRNLSRISIIIPSPKQVVGGVQGPDIKKK